MGLTTALVFVLAIVFMPNNFAFPFYYAYKAYLRNYVRQSTMISAFMLELIFTASIPGKLT